MHQMHARLQRRRPSRHRRQARRRRAPRRSRTASGCSTRPICWPSAGWPTASARSGTARRTYYNYNIRLEATNVCVASCLFCSFARLKPGDRRRLHDVARAGVGQAAAARAISRSPKSTSSTACIPICRSTTTRSCCAASSGSGPDIHLKCFTAVEIAFFADLYGMTDEQVLRELMAAGLDSLPGGGAEIFAERVRRKICARQVRHRSLPRRSTASRTGSACART